MYVLQRYSIRIIRRSVSGKSIIMIVYVKFDVEFVRSVEGSGRQCTHRVNIIFSNGYSRERYIRRIIEHKYDV